MKARWALLLLLGCQRFDVIASFLADAGATDGAAVGQDAEPSDTGLPDFCQGSGPIIAVGDQGRQLCGGAVARRTFRYALCTCDDYVSSNSLRSDSFDSSNGPYTEGGTGGSIGFGGRVQSGATMEVGGSLWAGSDVNMNSGVLSVQGDLKVGGALMSPGEVSVGRNAEVQGGVDTGPLTVQGTLTLPAGAPLSPDPPQAGVLARGPVRIPPPCACAPQDLVDVAAHVRARAQDNDNEVVQLDPGALANLQEETQLSLPCGRYYVRGIGGAQTLRLIITGRVALFVDGDLSLQQPLRIELQGGELDLLVSGNIVSDAPLELGDAARPAQVRLYVGGAGTIQLGGGARFFGNLYAPRSELVSGGPVEAFGALFVRRVAIAGALTLHYDTAVLGGTCEEPSPGCGSCLDCPNTACVEGACIACEDDSECCPPLRCARGGCVPVF